MGGWWVLWWVVDFVVAVGIRVRLGCDGGVQVCRLWVALMVVLGDFGGWVKIRLMGEDVGQILALLKVNNRG